MSARINPRINARITGEVLAALATMLPAIAGAQTTLSKTTNSSPGVTRVNAPGWVGISLIQNGKGDDNGVALEFPVIASVEPGSPANAAGLAAGDTILAYNGVDAHTNPLAMSRFLNPGQRLTFRIRRNGVRDIPVTVALRTAHSSNFSVGMRVDARNLALSPLPEMLQFGAPAAFASPVAAHQSAPLAGAQLTRINAGLAASLNVPDTGILVVDVGPGSPALKSGLMPGDVIVKADSIEILSPLELMRALRAASDHALNLVVVRRGKQQKIALKW